VTANQDDYKLIQYEIAKR